MRIHAGFLGLTLAAAPACLSAAEPSPAADDSVINFVEITPEQERAITRGLEYLARTQNNTDGSWGVSGQEGGHKVAATALAGIAFLSHGDTPSQGKYAPNLRKAIDFLLSQSDPNNGLICHKGGGGHSPMHEHGYAMWFLAQAYGMHPSQKTNEKMRTVLGKAVDLTSRSQTTLGGWFYTPDSTQHEGSITATQIEGLRAAKDAGVYVDRQVISKAISFMKVSQNTDGSIMYQPGQGSRGTVALTAAGIAVMYNAGEFNKETDAIIEKCMKFLDTSMKNSSIEGIDQGHKFYTHLYLSQSIYLAGAKRWNQYFPKMRKHLLDTQSSEGAWQGNVGPTFDTAVACTILQIPYRYLPILQK